MFKITRKQFRLLAAASLFCLFAWIVVAISDPLPEPLASYRSAQGQTGVTLQAILDLAAFAGMLVSYVGLFFFKRWGRAVFIGMNAVLAFLTCFEHPVIVTGSTNALDSLCDMFTGAIIAISLCTPLFAPAETS